MAEGDKTEQATPRRRDKAREQGQVARSRELAGALIGFAGLLVVLWISAAQLQRWRSHGAAWTDLAWQSDFNPGTPILLWTGMPRCAGLSRRWAWCGCWRSPAAWPKAASSLPPRLCTPNIERLSPAKKLEQMFSLAGLGAVAEIAAPVLGLLYLGIYVLASRLGSAPGAGQMPPGKFGQLAVERALEVCWKSSLVLLPGRASTTASARSSKAICA